ncbi:MAG: phytanoyl-CoA dioxygenase family protein [Xenococcaceae cyanobacterium]
MQNYLEAIARYGFAIIPKLIDDNTINLFIEQLFQLRDRPDLNCKAHGIRDLLNVVPIARSIAYSESVQTLVKQILGDRGQVVRGIFFDKTPEANWKVPWHQDLTIAVRDRAEIDGYTSWSIKAGIIHVQPPISILEKMLAVRIHLDDADESNGALKVLPGSHSIGRLSNTAIQEYKSKVASITCSAKRGDVLIMRPLLLHASSPAVNPNHRRVIHFELLQQQPHTIIFDLVWEECAAVDDTPLTNA